MAIRQLTPETINRIAAGEVVERPASVVKELVENALDAGAGEIEVVTASGGLALIRVTDNGAGMTPDDLALCVERHATSKLSDDDLFAIRTLGFRGEALPSIGSVAKLTILSRARDSAEAFAVAVDRGAKSKLKPAASNSGTSVEVRDLFSSVPARLKFLKSERAENMAVTEILKRLAMAHSDVGFSLTTGERASLRFPREASGRDGLLARLGRIMGLSSWPMRWRSEASVREFLLRASPGCRRFIGPTPRSSTCSSTPARSETSCSPARCALHMATSSHADAIPCSRSS